MDADPRNQRIRELEAENAALCAPGRAQAERIIQPEQLNRQLQDRIEELERAAAYRGASAGPSACDQADHVCRHVSVLWRGAQYTPLASHYRLRGGWNPLGSPGFGPRRLVEQALGHEHPFGLQAVAIGGEPGCGSKNGSPPNSCPNVARISPDTLHRTLTSAGRPQRKLCSILGHGTTSASVPPRFGAPPHDRTSASTHGR